MKPPPGWCLFDLDQKSPSLFPYKKSFQSKDFQMKTVSSEEAVSMIPDGATVMIGGFMGVGTPERLIDEIVRQGKRNLTVIANDTAVPGRGIGKLVDAGLINRTIASHIGLNPETQKQMIAGKMAVDLVPQGTLIERIRAGGFGLGGVLTPTGVGTVVEEGKQKDRGQRRDLPDRNGTACRLRIDRCVSRRLSRQSLLRSDGAKFQPGHRHGRRHHDRHSRAYRAGRADRSGSRRDARAAGRLSRDKRMKPMDAQTIIAKRIAQGAAIRNAGQSRHWDPHYGGELRPERGEGLLSVGKRPDRDGTDTRRRHGAPAAHRRRRPAGYRTAGRLHLRQRHVVRADPRRPCRYYRARRAAGRRTWPARELDDSWKDGAGNGRRDGSGHRRKARDHRHAAHCEGQAEDRQQMHVAADFGAAGRSCCQRNGGYWISGWPRNASGKRARRLSRPGGRRDGSSSGITRSGPRNASVTASEELTLWPKDRKQIMSVTTADERA